MPRQAATEKTIAKRVIDLVSTFDQCIVESTDVFTGPSIYFHFKTLERFKELGSLDKSIKDELFANYVYAAVACWGMHRMGPKGAKMVAFDTFRESLMSNAERIQKLSVLQIQSIPENETQQIVDELWDVVSGARGIKVSASKPPLVAATKVLHHLIPGLMPPIDRTYTAAFFKWNNRMQDCPDKMFRDTFPRLMTLAQQIESPARKYLGTGFNTSLTKIVDNAIVGFVRLNGLNPDEEPD